MPHALTPEMDQRSQLELLTKRARVVFQEVDPVHLTFPGLFAQLDLAENLIRWSAELNSQQLLRIAEINNNIRRILEGKVKIITEQEFIILAQALRPQFEKINEIIGPTGGVFPSDEQLPEAS